MLVEFLGGGSAPVGRSGSRGLLLVHANIFVYALCFWIQQPVIPYLSEELGADAVAFGSLQSAMSVLSLLGGALMGRWTDTHGAKSTIMLSQAGSLVMYSLTAGATSFMVLCLSRAPAFFQHAMLCSQAAVAGLVDGDKRSVAMGRLSLSYALGMVLGSAGGGQLSRLLGYRATAGVSAVITLFVLLADALLLNTFHKPEADSTSKEASNNNNNPFNDLLAFGKVASMPKVKDLLLLTMPVSVATGMLRSMMPLAGKEAFGLESSDLGMYISFAAVVGLVTNVFVLGPVMARLGEPNALAGAILLTSVCFLGFTQINNFSGLLALTVPKTMASTVLYTLSSSLMSLAVDQDKTGTAISISHGSRSVVGILAPILGGLIYEYQGMNGLAYFAAAASLVSLAVARTIASDTLHAITTAANNDNRKTK